MGAMSIINQEIVGIVYELSEGLMADAISHWQLLSKAMGRCASVCDDFTAPSTKKCADCLAGKLINKSNTRHISEEERQRHITLARELKVWVDLKRG